MRALAAAGCSKNLTSLLLWCECRFCLFSFLLLSLTLTVPSSPFPFLRCTATVNRRITSNNFAAVLGLPKAFHQKEPQAVHRLWQLRSDQFHFLQGIVDKVTAILLWDEQHGSFFFCSFLSFVILNPPVHWCHSEEDEKLDPWVFTWSPRGYEVGRSGLAL